MNPFTYAISAPPSVVPVGVVGTDVVSAAAVPVDVVPAAVEPGDNNEDIVVSKLISVRLILQ
jgi:hypothetical protein